jgi:hypothetical protein
MQTRLRKVQEEGGEGATRIFGAVTPPDFGIGLPRVRMSWILGVILFLVLVVGSASGLRIVPWNTTIDDPSPVVLLSPRIHYMSPQVNYPISGYLEVSLGRMPTGDLRGKILLHKMQSRQFIEDLCESLKDSGLAAFIVLQNSQVDYPGLTEYGRSRRNLPNQPFPVFDITLSQNKTLEPWFDPVHGLFAVIDTEDANPWDKFYNKWIPALSWVIIAICCFILTLTVYKLTLHILRDGFAMNIPQLVLWMNLVSNILRILHLLIDPFGRYGIYPYWWVQIGMTIPAPFLVAASLMMTLYWHEMIKRVRQMNAFLDQGLVPFLIVSLALFAFELATCLARGLGAIIAVLVIVTALIYAVVILTLLVFFIITKIRLQRLFHKLNKKLNVATKKHGQDDDDASSGSSSKKEKKSEKNQRRLGLASNIVILTGVSLFIYLISLIAAGIGNIFWIPTSCFVIIVGLLSSMTILSLLQVIIIRAPPGPWKRIFSQVSFKRKSSGV